MVKRSLVLAVALLVVMATAGHALNLIETAAPVGEAQVALTFGIGVAATELGPGGAWFVAPQGRLAIGLLDRLELGIHSGLSTQIGSGAFHWLGTLFDVKVVSMHVPDMYTFAWGAGGGLGLDFFGEGWGVFLQLLFESHSPFFPVFVNYRSIVSFDAADGGSIESSGYLAGGLRVRLAPIARLLLVVDVYDGLASLGLGLEIAF